MLITIYQVNIDRDNARFESDGKTVAFMPYREKNFDFSVYDKIYSYIKYTHPDKASGYKVVLDEEYVFEFLDEIFLKFNLEHARPDDYKGRSLSISDIVRIDDDFYYCDRFGWVKINIM